MPKRQGRPVKDFRPQKDRAKPKGGIPLDELLTGARRLPLLAAAQNGEYRRKTQPARTDRPASILRRTPDLRLRSGAWRIH
jgi:hypothetical protein